MRIYLPLTNHATNNTNAAATNTFHNITPTSFSRLQLMTLRIQDLGPLVTTHTPHLPGFHFPKIHGTPRAL